MLRRNLNALVCLFGLLLTGTVPAAEPPRTNLLCEEASGFEKPLPSGTMATLWDRKDTRITSEESYRGQHSLELTLTKKTKRVFLMPKGITFKAGEVLTASAYLKGDRAGGPILIYLWGTDKLWNAAQVQKFSYGTVQPEWQQFKVTLKLKKDINVLGVMIAGATAKGVSKVYIDEVKMERGTSATPSIPNRKNVTGALDRSEVNLIPFDPSGQPGKELEMSSFYLQNGTENKVPAPQKTSMFLSADGDHLFVRFRCQEAHPEKMVCRSTPDNPDWNDDRVELHMSLAGRRLKSRPDYFSINADGVFTTTLDLKGQDPAIRTAKGKDHWELSFRLPLKAFGLAGAPGQLWRISAGRFHRTGHTASSALAPVKKHFNRDDAAFKNFVLSGNGKLPDAILVSPGEMAEYANLTGENLMVFDLPGPKDLSGWKLKLNSQTVSPFSVKDNQVSFLYQIRPGMSGTLNWQLLNSRNRPAGQGSFIPEIFKPNCRVFTTPNPLFEELFGRKRTAERLNMSWGMIIGDLNYHQALKTGVPYSLEEILRRYKKAGIRLMLNSAGELAENLPEMRKGNYFRPTRGFSLTDFEKWVEEGKALPCAWYSFITIAGENADHQRGITWRENGYFGMPLDPINRAAYLALAKVVAQKIRKGMKVYFFGDEVNTLNSTRGLEMNTAFNRKNHGEYLDFWNEDVKKKWGGGRFGIPWGMKRGTPERRPYQVAYSQYMASELAKLALETRNIVKKINPALIMLSDDSYGNPSSQGVQYWRLYADCGSFQLGEGGGTSGQNFPDYMFTAKLVRDLSGLDELIVCPHEPLDGYPTGAMNSREIIELLSQCIRGGATGFHFFPSSFTGVSRTPANAASNAIGYPAAFEYMVRITEILNRMPDLKFPATRTAVLVADDTMISMPKYSRLRGAFRLVGLDPAGWFHFVSDTHLREGWKDLSKYQVCYVPAGDVFRIETVRKLEEYVRNGGILICADPDLLRYNQFFEDSSALREKLLGVSFGKSKEKTVRWNGGKIEVSGKTVKLIPVPDSNGRVLGTYPDGSAAVYEYPLGKGKVIAFGFDLFLEENAEKKEVSELFTGFHRNFGEKLGQPIWRFKFPTPALPKTVMPAGKCLTGNYGFWDRHRFNAGRLENVTVPGKVIIRRNGEKPSAEPFGRSRLTDRLRYFRTQDTFDRKNGHEFTEKFGAGKHHVIFEFGREVELGDLVLMYAEGEADITVEKESGNGWTAVAAEKCSPAEKLEVRRKMIHAPAAGKRFRLTVDVPAGKHFVIAETDLWGKVKRSD